MKLLVNSGEKRAESDSELRLDLFWHLFREGRLREARALCGLELNSLEPGNVELRVRWSCCWAKCEREAGNSWGALCCHALIRDLLPGVTLAPRVKALIGLAITYENLAAEGEGADFRERALECYREALLDAAGEPELLGVIENNTASVLVAAGRAEEALQFLAEARRRVIESGETWRLADVDDTLARALLAAGRHVEALEVATRAVTAAKAGGEEKILARALDTLDAVTRAMKERLPEEPS